MNKIVPKVWQPLDRSNNQCDLTFLPYAFLPLSLPLTTLAHLLSPSPCPCSLFPLVIQFSLSLKSLSSYLTLTTRHTPRLLSTTNTTSTSLPLIKRHQSSHRPFKITPQSSPRPNPATHPPLTNAHSSHPLVHNRCLLTIVTNPLPALSFRIIIVGYIHYSLLYPYIDCRILRTNHVVTLGYCNWV